MGRPVDHFRAEHIELDSSLTGSQTLLYDAPIARMPYDSLAVSGLEALREVSDFAGSAATTARLNLNETAYGRIGSAGDVDWIRVDLVAGQAYQFRLHGIGSGELVDPYLRLRDANGVQVAENDDAGNARYGNQSGVDSFIQFTAPTTGAYYLDVQSYTGAAVTTGDYIVTAATNNAAGMVFTADEIAWQLVSNGWNFFGGNTRSFNVGADNSLTVNITNLTAQGQFLARNALRAWTEVTGIAFVETAGAAEISFDDSDAGTTAYANSVVSGSTITSSTVMITTGWLSQFGTGLNSYSFETYIHEVGHALGLAHGGNYNGSATFGVDNYYVNDGLALSIMSYMQARNDEFAGPNTFLDASFRYMLTPAIADIIAIQYLYGDRGTAFSGNTTYGYGSNTGNTAIDGFVTLANASGRTAMTIWDEGGVDTLNFANYSGAQVINLNAESFSSVIGGVSNLSIARGVSVENANGGGGNDQIFGNALANVLNGNFGNDLILGNAGNDTINGGAGADALYGGDNNDTILGEIGNDYLDGQGENDNIYGGDNNDILVGNIGNDYLDGQGENDELYGNDGNDILVGNHGTDYLDGGDGRDELYGNDHNDTLLGNLGDDYLDGQGENDVLYGGVGNDTLYGNIGHDQLWGGTGADTLIGGLGDDQFRFQLSDLQAGTRDTIADFAEAGGGNADLLVLYGISSGNVTTSLVNGHTLIQIAVAGGTAEIVLLNFTPAQLADQMFFL